MLKIVEKQLYFESYINCKIYKHMVKLKIKDAKISPGNKLITNESDKIK